MRWAATHASPLPSGANLRLGVLVEHARSHPQPPAPYLAPVLHILYLDTEHVSDPLFLDTLAQQFHKHPVGHRRTLIVHGSSEKVERTFESDGVFIEREDGLLPVETEEQRRLVERDLRETNQSIVAALTDQVVPTVGVQGTDRQLLHRTESGAVEAAPNLGWLDALLKQHVVAVVSSMIDAPDSPIAEEVPLYEAASALGQYFMRNDVTDAPVQVVFFHPDDTPGIRGENGAIRDRHAPPSRSDDVPHAAALSHLAQAGIPALITNVQAFFSGSRPEGTAIVDPG
ncbi:MAG: hypothetical protein PPP56_09140 [Longimonas sp.]|uniref:acetylglutamate kinase n=1 Tax=Longimonas sp. TaxID=2039626 RepID=UPI003346F010